MSRSTAPYVAWYYSLLSRWHAMICHVYINFAVVVQVWKILLGVMHIDADIYMKLVEQVSFPLHCAGGGVTQLLD